MLQAAHPSLLAEFITALVRGLMFIGMELGAIYLIDRVFLKGFNTVEEIKGDPKAIALLLGLLAVALALAIC